ncbi:PREDICTED: kelch-like protein 34 [Cyprinodon variegatus]|uniref:Kelch like family member 34 n=1 Tax=Cyprinodon variegatus TaxID=28743 RepID=A0A3Q2FST2_CYPVA|nr:PREDICTED: kelch-like protein 34 [Cyprinodon variegatus]
MDTYSVLYSSSHNDGLLSGFQRLRDHRKMCDVVLESGGVSFPCHRTLLASSSEYFWALFGETTAERSADFISLPALTPEGLEAILDFLYSGWLSISSSTLPVVVEASRYLQVEAALSICERFMADGLTNDNCCFYANLADQHFLLKALEAANQTIAKKMVVLLQRNRAELLGLNFSSLMAVLDADDIPGVKEVDLIKLCLDWLDENGPLPLLKSNLLLSRLRFGLVSPSDLSNLSHRNRAMATPLIRGQLTRALEYHQMGSAKPIGQSRQSTMRGSTSHVLLVGGGTSTDLPEQQVLAFDSSSKRFTVPGLVLPLRLRSPCVCSVGGFLFVMGGDNIKTCDDDEKKSVAMSTSCQVWRYDPRFSHWEQMESMLERRMQFTCCIVEDVIYAIGGRHLQPDSGMYTSVASVEYYDMASGAWRRAAALPYPLHGHASTVLDKSIYVSGGLPSPLSQIHSNNQEVNREISRECLCWDLIGRVWEKRASMSVQRFGHRLATAHGHIYALLGMYEPFCDIERYDPQSNYWTRLKPLANGLFCYGLQTLECDNLLLFGGRRWSDGQQVSVRSVLEYDTKKDRWREIAQLPRPLTGTECTLLRLPDNPILCC